MTHAIACAHGRDPHPRATCYPIVCVCSRDTPRDPRASVQVAVAVPLCRACATAARPLDYLPLATQNRIAALAADHGLLPPDFTRAWLRFGLIGDADWSDLTGQREGETVQ